MTEQQTTTERTYPDPTRGRTRRKLTDEQAEKLRRTVPNDPRRLPKGRLACAGCGVAHAGPVRLTLPIGLGNPSARAGAGFTRCPECQALHERAGGSRAVEAVLQGLSVIGVAMPEGADPTPLVPWLRTLAEGLPWADPESPDGRWCSPWPWAHVTLSQRRALKEAYLLALQARVRPDAPPIALAPPWGPRGCLFCGVGTLAVPALDVVRAGGRENAARRAWREVQTKPSALGGRGPARVDGWVCPPCSDALDQVGAVGVSARARALEQYLRSAGRDREADRVRSIIASYDNIRLPGWAGLGVTRPNATPWAHIVVPDPAGGQPVAVAVAAAI